MCAPVIERLRFLFNELRPAVSNDLSIVSKLKLLSSQPRWRRITQKLIRDRRKKRGGSFKNLQRTDRDSSSSPKRPLPECVAYYFLVPKKSESADIEEPKLENEGTKGEELNVHIVPTPADRKSPTSKTSKVPKQSLIIGTFTGYLNNEYVALTLMFYHCAAGQVASASQHCGQRPEVPLAETQRPGCVFSVQPDGHHRGVCTERGAAGRGEDEEVSPQAGDLSCRK